MKLILRAIFLLSVNSYLFSQSVLPKNLDLNKLKDLGISPAQIKKLKNSKTLKDNENIDQFEFDRSDTENNSQNTVELRNELSENYKKDISLNASNENTLYKVNETEKNIELKRLNTSSSTINKTEKTIDSNLKDESEKYFGYNVFSGNAELFQKSVDDVIDPNYLISPGDEIIIMLWGETELNEPYTVTRDGYIFVDNIGQVFVNGLTLSKLEKKLFNILKKVYATLGQGGGIAATFFDVSLGSSVLRPVRIFAVGEVSSSGAYDVKKSTTLYTSLYYFGGPSFKGSLRDIRLMRKGELIQSIDFYNYLLSGKLIDDIQLQRDDLIFIPLRGKTVTVSGEIGRPYIYELNEEENLTDLIKIAGGLKETTYMDRVQISRIIPFNKRKGDGVDRTIVDVSLNEIKRKKDVQIYDGDLITFYKINDRLGNIVTINGAVNRPGTYDLGKGLRVSELVKKSGGLLGNAFNERATVTRKNKDLTFTNITISLKNALQKKSKEDIKLNSEDALTIYDNSSMIYKTSVFIDGHVIDPGIKDFKIDMSLEDLVFLGGGFKNESHLSKTFLDRADLYSWDEGYTNQELIVFNLDSVLSGIGLGSLKIRMGDRVKIYNKDEVLGSDSKTITVSGHVKNPGQLSYLENITIKDILFIAGGLNDSKHMERMYFERFDVVRFELKKNSFNLFNSSLTDELKTNSFKILPNDKIIFYSKDMFSTLGRVSIDGAINNPGSYELKDKMTVSDLIIESGGVIDSLYYFRLEVASIDYKSKDQNNYSAVNVIDLVNDESLYGDKFNGYIMRPFDKVIVRPTPFFNSQKLVYVGGNVNYPGNYFLKSANERASDLIKRAGGLTIDGYPEASSFTRSGNEVLVSFKKLIKNSRSKENFVVLAGDSIIIGKKPNMIKITGQINRPGNFQFIEGNNLKDYIQIAGGYTNNAVRSETFVVYPGGKSLKNKLIFSPRIIDGSEIIVPAKEEVEAFNLTEYVTNLTTIWSELTQAYLMIILAARQG